MLFENVFCIKCTHTWTNAHRNAHTHTQVVHKKVRTLYFHILFFTWCTVCCDTTAKRLMIRKLLLASVVSVCIFSFLCVEKTLSNVHSAGALQSFGLCFPIVSDTCSFSSFSRKSNIFAQAKQTLALTHTNTFNILLFV